MARSKAEGSGRSLAGMTVAVTGTSGFIGARLVEILRAADRQCRVRALSRRRSGSAGDRVVDLTQPAAVKAALQGCDVLVHCAFDFSDMATNVAIAGVIGRECAANGVRLVHVSTAAVYEPLPDGMLDESVNNERGGSEYKHAKLAIENELVSHVRDCGLDLVILQPTIVYGPLGGAWTDSPVRELLTGTVVLPDGGNGLCNAVYIDDVCQAVVAALTARLPSGERILVSGPRPVAWKDFYGAYQDVLQIDALRLIAPSPTGYGIEHGIEQETTAAPSSPRRHASLKRFATRLLGTRARSRLNMTVGMVKSTLLGRKVYTPTGAKLALFQARCHVRIDKARRLLGYEPEFDLPQGMQMTAPYVLRTYGRLARLRAWRA